MRKNCRQDVILKINLLLSCSINSKTHKSIRKVSFWSAFFKIHDCASFTKKNYRLVAFLFSLQYLELVLFLVHIV